MTLPLVLVGDSSFAQIAKEYFDEGGVYKVQAFFVERAYLKVHELMGLPVFPLEELLERFDLNTYVFVSIAYNQMNRTRQRLYEQVKSMGYLLASYISPRAYIASSAVISEHCFIFENNVIQSFTTLGPNNIIWSGNHIGHHSKIGAHNFISSHVVIAGYTNIGSGCFIGINSSIANHLEMGDDVWVQPGAIIKRKIPSGVIVTSPQSEISKVTSYRYFKIQPPQL